MHLEAEQTRLTNAPTACEPGLRLWGCLVQARGVLPLHSQCSTSPRALSSAPGESDSVCHRHFFQRNLSAPALYQLSEGEGINKSLARGRCKEHLPFRSSREAAQLPQTLI